MWSRELRPFVCSSSPVREFSARLAQKEDEQALREEKMHEYEKRKKKMEREKERR